MALSGKGRKFNHVEDFLTFYGSEGGWEIHDMLVNLDQCRFTTKWDGRIAVYFGREDGKFAMGTKAMWSKGTMPTNAGELYRQFMANDKGEAWRPAMAESLATIFEHVRWSVPDDFDGFVMGDVLYMPNQPFHVDDGYFAFEPNRVTYYVDIDSDMGDAMEGTSTGIAVHSWHPEWGMDGGKHATGVSRHFDRDYVMFIEPMSSSIVPQVDGSHIDDLARILQTYGGKFDTLTGAGDIVYKYTNFLAKTGTIDRMSADDFFTWLESESNVSSSKISKIHEFHEHDENAFPALFSTLNGIMSIKNEIIRQLDEHDNSVIEWTGDQEGGEGYILNKYNMKFIPRDRWVPENWERQS